MNREILKGQFSDSIKYKGVRNENEIIPWSVPIKPKKAEQI